MSDLIKAERLPSGDTVITLRLLVGGIPEGANDLFMASLARTAALRTLDEVKLLWDRELIEYGYKQQGEAPPTDL